MEYLWEQIARGIIWVTKALTKGLLIMFTIIYFIFYTNIGGSYDALNTSYYNQTGKELKPSEVLIDIQERVNNSMDNINDVSTMFDNAEAN